MKFGGTSVGSAERIEHVARLITEDDKPKIVVLSAMAGTTNTLVEIAAELMMKHQHEALTLLGKLRKKYEEETRKLFPTPTSYDKAWTIVNETFFFLEQLCYQDHFTLFDEKKILARGELLSTAMMLCHLEDRGVKALGLPALEYMRTDANAGPDEDYIATHLKAIMASLPQDCKLFITEGYICRNAYGEIDNLQRGGSDYTAALVGAAIDAEEIQIWTDIDGMHNNDPRYVEQTKPVRKLHFDEAAELAFFGAKILHPTCILPAKRKSIPVRLLNTLEPTAEGTMISLETDKDRIKAVAAKDGISMLRIKSNHSISSWSFMSKFFGALEQHRTSVDMITSSDVAVSVAVDNPTALLEIQKELATMAQIEIYHDLTIICVVGDMEWDNVGYEAMILEGLKDIPLWMISYGGSDYSLAVLIRTEDKKAALKALSQHLFLVLE